ncbi:MAG: hypothetical protein ACI8T1_001613 [Verrucomicrobiales bacterium]
MFSQPDVIEVSRKFVCVRIDSYESEENQKIVRSHLNGRFENTAFCILAPDGETRLSRSARSPSQVYGEASDFVSELKAILTKHEPKIDDREAPVPDFHSFKLALNIASADQRVLVLLTAPEDQLAAAESRLRRLSWNPKVQGRFHFDLESTGTWKEPLSQKADAGAGIYLINPGEYGLEGTVIERLDLDAGPEQILTSLAKANDTYAKTTKKKIYSDHVQEGRSEGKRIEMAVLFGEDRDGDGEIDRAPGRGR